MPRDCLSRFAMPGSLAILWTTPTASLTCLNAVCRVLELLPAPGLAASCACAHGRPEQASRQARAPAAMHGRRRGIAAPVVSGTMWFSFPSVELDRTGAGGPAGGLGGD